MAPVASHCFHTPINVCSSLIVGTATVEDWCIIIQSVGAKSGHSDVHIVKALCKSNPGSSP